MRNACRISFAALLLFTGLSCAPAPESRRSEPLRLSVVLWSGYFPAFLADSLGFFEKRGVDVEISVHEDMAFELAEFAAGSYDVIAVPLGNILPNTSIDPDIKIFLCPDLSHGGDALIGLESAPDTPIAFKGLRIGTTLLGFGEVFVLEWLKQNGVSPDDVTLLHVEAPEVFNMIKSGNIDVGHTWSPYLEEATAGGADVWFDSSKTPGLIPDVVVVRGDVHKTRYDDLKAFTDAWFEAVEWWNEHPEEARKILSERLKIAPDQITTKGIRLLGRSENVEALSEGGSLVNAIKLYADFFVARGVTDRALDPATLIDRSLLE